MNLKDVGWVAAGEEGTDEGICDGDRSGDGGGGSDVGVSGDGEGIVCGGGDGSSDVAVSPAREGRGIVGSTMSLHVSGGVVTTVAAVRGGDGDGGSGGGGDCSC